VARVLFVCVENSSRSQMAEAFTLMQGAGVLEPVSAGSRPSGVINPRAIAAMHELGYDLSSHVSKGLSEVGAGPWDYVITMGCGDACPQVLAGHRENWGLPDPTELSDERFREVRDEIGRRVSELVERVREGG
jgi:arsenate reductase